MEIPYSFIVFNFCGTLFKVGLKGLGLRLKASLEIGPLLSRKGLGVGNQFGQGWPHLPIFWGEIEAKKPLGGLGFGVETASPENNWPLTNSVEGFGWVFRTSLFLPNIFPQNFKAGVWIKGRCGFSFNLPFLSLLGGVGFLPHFLGEPTPGALFFQFWGKIFFPLGFFSLKFPFKTLFRFFPYLPPGV